MDRARAKSDRSIAHVLVGLPVVGLAVECVAAVVLGVLGVRVAVVGVHVDGWILGLDMPAESIESWLIGISIEKTGYQATKTMKRIKRMKSLLQKTESRCRSVMGRNGFNSRRIDRSI